MITIIPIADLHQPAIDRLLDDRFGPARHNRTAYRLRDSARALPAFSFVAIDDDRLVGSVQCWPIALRGLGGSRQPLILLGPVAVAADCEGQGLGSQLMRSALAAIDAATSPQVLLIGDFAYYGRFGFAADATRHWHLPGPVDHERLLLRGPTAGLPHTAWVEPVSRSIKVA